MRRNVILSRAILTVLAGCSLETAALAAALQQADHGAARVFQEAVPAAGIVEGTDLWPTALPDLSLLNLLPS